jgi:hypothetical protein
MLGIEEGDGLIFRLSSTQHNISVRNTFPRVCSAQHTLGFTHYWGKTRKRGYAVKRKTAAKRLNRSLKAINQWLQRHMHLVLCRINSYTYIYAAFFSRFFTFVHPGEISSSR